MGYEGMEIKNQWLVFIFAGAFFILLFFRYIRPILRMRSEFNDVFDGCGKVNLIIMVTWLTILTYLYIRVIYIKPDFGMFLYVAFLGIIPFAFVMRGIVFINDNELFVDGKVIQRNEIESIDYETRLVKNGIAYIACIHLNDGKVVRMAVTNKASKLLTKHFPSN